MDAEERGRMIAVAGLFAYPVKSCRGIELREAEVVERGIAHDREWLVVDSAGRFMTQRDWPSLARVTVAVVPGGLRIEAKGRPKLEVATPLPSVRRREVTIWKDTCTSRSAGSEAAAWFSDLLGTDCELVWMPPEEARQVDPDVARPGDRVAFADGFPFLLISQGSLDELNRRLDTPVPMDRFRPNIVVDGCAPHAEDGWAKITIGDVVFTVAKPCARCVITTTDQRTCRRSSEPLKTLAGYRLSAGAVLFGQNLVHSGRGEIRVGDVCLIEPSFGNPECR
jgi:uncharacterized protein YcbX